MYCAMVKMVKLFKLQINYSMSFNKPLCLSACIVLYSYRGIFSVNALQAVSVSKMKTKNIKETESRIHEHDFLLYPSL